MCAGLQQPTQRGVGHPVLGFKAEDTFAPKDAPDEIKDACNINQRNTARPYASGSMAEALCLWTNVPSAVPFGTRVFLWSKPSQVYFGKLRDGTEVAVKCLRHIGMCDRLRQL